MPVEGLSKDQSVRDRKGSTVQPSTGAGAGSVPRARAMDDPEPDELTYLYSAVVPRSQYLGVSKLGTVPHRSRGRGGQLAGPGNIWGGDRPGTDDQGGHLSRERVRWKRHLHQ